MKKYLLSTLFAFATLGALVSCNKDSGLTNVILPMSTGTSSSSANPVLAYTSSTGGKNSKQTIAVMNSDGSNQTNVYTAGTTTTGLSNPCWSADGKSIAWIENSSVLKACDVSVVSGVPTGSNVRTIYTSTNSIVNQAWCSVAATAEIAFVSLSRTGNSLCVVSTSGGTPTTLCSSSTRYYNSSAPSWSPDDSYIAYMDHGKTTHSTILHIINASTGAQSDSSDLSKLYEGHYAEWARSGNDIAFNDVDTNSGGHSHIYYYTAFSGNAASSQSTIGTHPTWSPDDANLMINDANSKGLTTVYEIPAGGTTKTEIATVGITGVVKWKR